MPKTTALGKMVLAWRRSAFQWGMPRSVSRTAKSKFLSIHEIAESRSACQLASKGPILEVPNMGEDLNEQGSKALLLRELYVELNQKPKPQIVHFGVTNFEFVETRSQKDENSKSPELQLELHTARGVRSLLIRPLQQFEFIINRLKTVRSIEVTCEVIARLSPSETIENLTDEIGDLRYLLSVARGTKIQWIYRDTYDEGGSCVTRTHATTVTKPYGPLAVIDPRRATDTKRFLEQTYPV